jgi:hypothetical protein
MRGGRPWGGNLGLGVHWESFRLTPVVFEQVLMMIRDAVQAGVPMDMGFVFFWCLGDGRVGYLGMEDQE